MADAFLSTFTFETQLSDASINKLATQVQQAVIRGLKQASNEIKGIKDVFSVNLGNRTADAASASPGAKGIKDVFSVNLGKRTADAASASPGARDKAEKNLEAVATEGIGKSTKIMDAMGTSLGGIFKYTKLISVYVLAIAGIGKSTKIMDAMGTSLGGLFKYTKLISVYVLAISIGFSILMKVFEKLEARFKETKDFLIKGGLIENKGRGSLAIARNAISGAYENAGGLYNREDVKKIVDRDVIGFSNMVKQLDAMGHSAATSATIMGKYLNVMTMAHMANEENIDSIMSLTSTVVRRFAYMGDGLKEHIDDVGKTYEMMFRGMDKQQAQSLEDGLKKTNLYMALQGETFDQMTLRNEQTNKMLNSLKAVGLGDMGGSLIKELGDAMWEQNAKTLTMFDAVNDYQKITTDKSMSQKDIAQKTISMLSGLGGKIMQYSGGKLAGPMFEQALKSLNISRDLAEKAVLMHKQFEHITPKQLEEKTSQFEAEQELKTILDRTTDPMKKLLNVFDSFLETFVDYVVPAMDMLMRWLSMAAQGKVTRKADMEADQFAKAKIETSTHLNVLSELESKIKQALLAKDYKTKEALLDQYHKYASQNAKDIENERRKITIDAEKSMQGKNLSHAQKEQYLLRVQERMMTLNEHNRAALDAVLQSAAEDKDATKNLEVAKEINDRAAVLRMMEKSEPLQTAKEVPFHAPMIQHVETPYDPATIGTAVMPHEPTANAGTTVFASSEILKHAGKQSGSLESIDKNMEEMIRGQSTQNELMRAYLASGRQEPSSGTTKVFTSPATPVAHK